jgi:hypothetical protein
MAPQNRTLSLIQRYTPSTPRSLTFVTTYLTGLLTGDSKGVVMVHVLLDNRYLQVGSISTRVNTMIYKYWVIIQVGG